MDLFNALLSYLHVDLTRGLVWTGLLASIATFYAFFRWARMFGIAGFLFNGGVAGFEFLKTLKFVDYQGGKTIAWKSIPLTMFVTQRGLLYAIPPDCFCSGAGVKDSLESENGIVIALLCHSGSSWRCTPQCHSSISTLFSLSASFWLSFRS